MTMANKMKRADKPDTTCLGEVAAELEMVQREGVDSDDEGQLEGSEEESANEEVEDEDE